jgi:hypothetical protein
MHTVRQPQHSKHCELWILVLYFPDLTSQNSGIAICFLHYSFHDCVVLSTISVFFFDEAWFSLCGEVNFWNNQYWSAENPKFIHKLPFHDERIGVWCAISAYRIIGPIFYDDTVNAARYVNNILSPFFAKLTEEKRLYSVLQLDSATANMAYASLEALRKVFGDHIISHGLWPPRAPDLVPCDFHLWGILKDRMHYGSQTNTIRGKCKI